MHARSSGHSDTETGSFSVDYWPAEEWHAGRPDGWNAARSIDPRPLRAVTNRATAESVSWRLGDIVFTRTLCSGAPLLLRRRTPGSLGDHWRVTFARPLRQDGSFPVVPHEARSARPRSPPGVGPIKDWEILTLHIPRRSDWADEDEQSRRREVNPQMAGLLAGFMDTLCRLLPNMSAEHAHSLSAATRALVAACVTPCLLRTIGDLPHASRLIDRARLLVRQNMACPEFGPRHLARLLAMSRSKLYRLFENHGGVGHFINRERLREAHRRLSSHQDVASIHVIGNEVGFLDHSTFSRAFRREFGYSPTEARLRSQAQQPSPTGTFLPEGTMRLEPGPMPPASSRRDTAATGATQA